MAFLSTKQSTDQLALGQPADLPMNMLLMQLDIAKCLMYEKQQWMIGYKAAKEPDNATITDLVVQRVQKIYKVASIPTIRKDKIKKNVLCVYEKRMCLQ